ncbi:MAG: hypothetical protein ACQEXX_22125 [Bacillota bacterium]
MILLSNLQIYIQKRWFAIPFGIVAVLTFMTPDAGNTSKLVCAYFTYILLGILYAAIKCL